MVPQPLEMAHPLLEMTRTLKEMFRTALEMVPPVTEMIKPNILFISMMVDAVFNSNAF